ncbi:hypothetical protein SEUCBS140593_000764 [Sporothrix eucalyptigena]|uniref:Carboxylesterase type B domain-containing protein n=1 Tax=Sporothrix eucalyptigena TaxID=1812306 RepID=A0ABP0AST3_9PEZI
MLPTIIRIGILTTVSFAKGAQATTLHAAHARSPPTVHTEVGTFVGNGSIAGLDQFLSIRYAAPPVGNLRFANPQRFSSHSNQTFQATDYGPGCLQDPTYALYNGFSEDCLTLNIVRPQHTPTSHDSSELLPVLFFIHGGGNQNGQAMLYNGTELVQYSVEIGLPIVYVACNYRLGGFGFTNSPALDTQGASNLGLKDQRLALQWAHDNIARFGGDPNRTVLFAQSAGAWNAQMQLHRSYTLEDIARQPGSGNTSDSQVQTDATLFRGLITESGSAGGLGPWYAEPPSSGAAAYEDLLVATNCSKSKGSIDCLRSVDVSILGPLLVGGKYGTQYTFDNDWFTSNLTDILVDYKLARMPILHGSNLDEGSILLPDPFHPPDRSVLINTISTALQQRAFNGSKETTALVARLAQNIYAVYANLSLGELGKGVNNPDPTIANDRIFWEAVAVFGDIMFHLARRAFLRRASVQPGVPAWGYLFYQQPPPAQLNLSYEQPGISVDLARRLGVYHGAELAYVFGEVSRLEGATADDVRISTAIMRSWLSFAYHLNPNSKDIPHWPQYMNQTTSNTTESTTTRDHGLAMIWADQGNESISVRPDTQRQSAYDAWNAALVALGREPLY